MKTLFKSLSLFASLAVLFACQKEEIDRTVAITTTKVTEITDYSAVSGGEITHDCIEQMSDTLCISRVQLYRKTKSLFGMSPTDLLRNFRLKKAIQLFKKEGFTISEVAYATGFTQPAYFTRCFKKEFGCTPTEFMSSLNNDKTE